MLFKSLALVSLLLTVLILPRIADILPNIGASLLWWKENINVDTNIRLRRDRDMVAAVLIVPFCLAACRLKLFDADFMNGLSEELQLCVTFGVFAGWLMIRKAVYASLRSRKINSSVYHAADSSANTYFIVLCALTLTVCGIYSVFDISLTAARIATFWVSGTIYLLYLVRKTQIFSSVCNFFRSFLYLCALEILPTGVLIASAVVF